MDSYKLWFYLELASDSRARRGGGSCKRPRMPSPTKTAPIGAGYRRRLAAQGQHQLVVALPRETVALIDELKERHGMRNRSQVLMQLIEQGREITQQ